MAAAAEKIWTSSDSLATVSGVVIGVLLDV
jgi:hypothetical protein